MNRGGRGLRLLGVPHLRVYAQRPAAPFKDGDAISGADVVFGQAADGPGTHLHRVAQGRDEADAGGGGR